MWTHEVVAAEQNDNGTTRVVASYTDGTRTILKEHPFTSEDRLSSDIAITLAQLESGSAFVAKFTPGPIDVTPKPVDPPTADQIAKSQAAIDKMRLSVLQQEIALGIRKPDNAEYLALL